MAKYHAVRTTVDGITFASKKEAARFVELRLMERAGEIGQLTLQPVWPLVVNGVKICNYIADFQYRTPVGRIVEDVKGVKTPVYKLKKKLMLAVYGIEIYET